MQTKYRNRARTNPDREMKEGRKRKEETVYTRSFGTKQKFGAANSAANPCSQQLRVSYVETSHD